MKIHLYKALVRPILEFPAYPIHLSSKTSKLKIQRIQNNAVRFFFNLKLSDKCKIKNYHEKIKLKPMNVRIHKLSTKVVSTIRDLYLCNNLNHTVKPYKYSNYTIQASSYRNKKRTLALRIKKYIYTRNHGKYRGILYNKNDPEKWKEPEPLYS